MILLAPDKFKGSLTATEVADALASGIRSVDPAVDVVGFPIADGGEGTVSMMLARGFDAVECVVAGPLGGPVTASYAFDGTTAVIEMAAAAGLELLGPSSKTALESSTYGVGELMLDAVDRGASHIVLGVGGSATTDGGRGALAALGATYSRSDVVTGARMSLTDLDTRLDAVTVTVACDVDNPLTGPRGAAAVYAPQKGASRSDVETLDRELTRFADAVDLATGTECRNQPGAGASGGLAFGMMAVLGATLVSGIDRLLELASFPDVLDRASLVVVGEGSLDQQTLRGKGPIGVARAARERGIPVIAVAGRNLLSEADIRAEGLSAVYSLEHYEPDVGRSMRNAADLLVRVGTELPQWHG